MTAPLISVFGLNVPTHEAIESVFSLAIGFAPVLGMRRATKPVCCP